MRDFLQWLLYALGRLVVAGYVWLEAAIGRASIAALVLWNIAWFSGLQKSTEILAGATLATVMYWAMSLVLVAFKSVFLQKTGMGSISLKR